VRKEIAIGVVLGVLTWLAIDGVNVVPAVFILLLLAGLMFTGVLNRITLKNSRKVAVSRTIGITFNDIGGQSTAKGELIEALEFVFKPEKLKSWAFVHLKEFADGTARYGQNASGEGCRTIYRFSVLAFFRVGIC